MTRSLLVALVLALGLVAPACGHDDGVAGEAGTAIVDADLIAGGYAANVDAAAEADLRGHR